jgi:hypothetical protein
MRLVVAATIAARACGLTELGIGKALAGSLTSSIIVAFLPGRQLERWRPTVNRGSRVAR